MQQCCSQQELRYAKPTACITVRRASQRVQQVPLSVQICIWHKQMCSLHVAKPGRVNMYAHLVNKV